jgi:hypothetical protein
MNATNGSNHHHQSPLSVRILLCLLWLSSYLLHSTHAFVGPFNTSEWDPVHIYREKLGLSYAYTPQFLHPEYCRYLTEEECQRQDEHLQRAPIEKEERMRLRNPNYDTTTTHDKQRQRQRRINESVGTTQCLMLLVQFADHTDRVLPDKSYFDTLCNGWGDQTVNPIGSLQDYFAQQSFNQYNIACTVYDWRVTEGTEAQYAQGVSGLLPSETAQQFFWPVLTAIDEEERQKDPFWLAQYDQDNDGFGDGTIDCLIVIHSGISAQAGETDCQGSLQKDRIWSQGHSASSTGWEDANNIGVSSFVINSAYNGNCDDDPSTLGILAHEL